MDEATVVSWDLTVAEKRRVPWSHVAALGSFLVFAVH